MLVKKIRILVFTAVLVSVTIMSSAQKETPLGDPDLNRQDLDRFDTDGDAKLSQEEKEVMFEAIALEAFTGQKLSREDLRGMRRGRGFSGPRGGRGMTPPIDRKELFDRFDTDQNGKLEGDERSPARKYVQSIRGKQSAGITSESAKKPSEQNELQTSQQSAPKTEVGLYDEKTLRTLYLRFPNADWYAELSDFYRTGVDIPADLIVDGKLYASVGISFRGNSSYRMTQDSKKKSFNIAIDYDHKSQHLYGYKTLKLLNSASDPSFIREVLYSRISRQYLPAPKANFIRLVINGENWGIYPNIQQFNKDFLQDWFKTKDGVRWKISPGRGSRGGSLVWNGPDISDYQAAYQLKTKTVPQNAWQDLIHLCKILDQTPNDQLEDALRPIFNIDGALWFIALDNVFIDGDGYIGRGADYNIYLDPKGRFHLVSHDNNETFGYAGGGGPNIYFDNQRMLSPVANEDNEMLPVISRLLSVPHIRARYLAHVRTIIDEWLDWDILEPIIKEYQSLIDATVKADLKKLYSYQAFINSQDQDYSEEESSSNRDGLENKDDRDGPPADLLGGPPRFGRGRSGHRSPSFKQFIEERRQFLLSHPEIDKEAPVIKSVLLQSPPQPQEEVLIKAVVKTKVKLDNVILHYASNYNVPFDSVIMSASENNNNVYLGEIPPFPIGTKVYYYVEARVLSSLGTTAFLPTKADFGAFSYHIMPSTANNPPIVINEIMAFNSRRLRDPQGEYDDWIELYNRSDKEISLSRMYLSDNKENPLKWTFPKNAKIPAGSYLIVWADEDQTDHPGLHTNFKLSKNGETVMLVDTSRGVNQILSLVEFGNQIENSSIGRYPNGTGPFRPLKETPKKENKL